MGHIWPTPSSLVILKSERFSRSKEFFIVGNTTHGITFLHILLQKQSNLYYMSSIVHSFCLLVKCQHSIYKRIYLVPFVNILSYGLTLLPSSNSSLLKKIGLLRNLYPKKELLRFRIDLPNLKKGSETDNLNIFQFGRSIRNLFEKE